MKGMGMGQERDWRDELPAKHEEPSLVKMLEDLAWGRPSHAAAVLEWAGAGLGSKDLDGLLRQRARGSWMESEEAGKTLGWCQALIDRGADPFAPGQDERGRSEPSFFEGIVRGGLWAYAAKLALATEDSKKAALEALRRLDKGYGSGMLSTLAQGGAAGVELGLALGIDSNSKLEDGRETPWALMLQDGASVEALAKAGADLSAQDKHGWSLEQKIAQMAAGKARQGLLDAFAVAKASKAEDGGGFKEAGKALEAVARDGSFKELSKLALAVGTRLREARGPSGWGVLETALLSANWSLALKAMESGEVDAGADCGVGDLPIGALALWAQHASTKRPTKANENAKVECVSKALRAALDSGAGADLLERAAKARAEGLEARSKKGAWKDAPEQDREKMERLATNWDDLALGTLFEVMAAQPGRPTWARARDCGLGQREVAKAAARSAGQDAVDQGGRCLWTAVAIDMETGRGWGESGAQALMNALDRRSSMRKLTLSDEALAQAWEAFWPKAWQEASQDGKEGYSRTPMAREMARSMGWALIRRAGDASEMLAAWEPERLVAAWEPGLGWEGEPAQDARGWIKEWAQAARPSGEKGQEFDARLALELARQGSFTALLAADDLAKHSKELSSYAFKAPPGLGEQMEAMDPPAGEEGRLAWAALCEAAGIDARRAQEAKVAREEKMARSRRL